MSGSPLRSVIHPPWVFGLVIDITLEFYLVDQALNPVIKWLFTPILSCTSKHIPVRPVVNANPQSLQWGKTDDVKYIFNSIDTHMSKKIIGSIEMDIPRNNPGTLI